MRLTLSGVGKTGLVNSDEFPDMLLEFGHGHLRTDGQLDSSVHLGTQHPAIIDSSVMGRNRRPPRLFLDTIVVAKQVRQHRNNSQDGNL
jgi:hypothetical protein